MPTDLDGAAFRPESFSRKFSAATHRPGVQPIRLHSLRHTYASRALHLGVSRQVFYAMLAHVEAGFTLSIDSLFMPHQRRAAVEMLAVQLISIVRHSGAPKFGAEIELMEG